MRRPSSRGIWDRISPAIWVTIKLAMPGTHVRAYGLNYNNTAPHFLKGFDEDIGTGLRHTKHPRALCLLTDNLGFRKLFHDAQVAQKHPQEHFPTHAGHGATYYKLMIRARPEDPYYKDRAAMAHFANAFSVKMRALANLTWHICAGEICRRFLVFCDWPITQWYIEFNLKNLGFQTMGIRASQGAREREKVVARFTDDIRTDVQVLVTSTRIAATERTGAFCIALSCHQVYHGRRFQGPSEHA